MAHLLTGTTFRGFADDGAPLVGGKLWTYVSGTTTPQPTYTDSTLTTPNANPITLNARGEAEVWIDPTKVYTFRVTTADGATVGTDVDDISGQWSGQILVQDAGGFFSNTPKTVESALQELANPQAKFAYSYNALRQVPIAKWSAILNRTSTDDHSAYIQAAIDTFGNASSTAQGQVYLPAGKWNLISSGLVLPYELGICGAGGRATHLCSLSDSFDAISFSQSAPSFCFQSGRISDLWITGPGYGMQGSTRITMAQAYAASAAGTNMANIAVVYPGVVPFTNASGINFNPNYGLNDPSLKRLWIEEFPNKGIRTYQPGNSSVNCIQFADISQVYLRYCNIGISLGYGFTGESFGHVIVSQFMLSKCFEFTINANNIGPQGIQINSLVGGWSPIGVDFAAATAGNIMLQGLHMESCTTAAVHTNSGNLGQLVIRDFWFAKCPVSFLGDAGGNVVLDTGTWMANGSSTDNLIKLTASSNFNVMLMGQHRVVANGTAPTSQISCPDINVFRGSVVRTSATTGSVSNFVQTANFMQVRGIASETSTVLPNNYSGSVAIASGATYVDVTFARQETDDAYNANPTVRYIGSNSTTGSITASSNSLTVASGTGSANGDVVRVAGAGASGATLITTISTGGGTTTWTLAASASITVTNAATTCARANASAWQPSVSVGGQSVNGFRVYFGGSAAPSTGYSLTWTIAR